MKYKGYVLCSYIGWPCGTQDGFGASIEQGKDRHNIFMLKSLLKRNVILNLEEKDLKLQMNILKAIVEMTPWLHSSMLRYKPLCKCLYHCSWEFFKEWSPVQRDQSIFLWSIRGCSMPKSNTSRNFWPHRNFQSRSKALTNIKHFSLICNISRLYNTKNNSKKFTCTLHNFMKLFKGILDFSLQPR